VTVRDFVALDLLICERATKQSQEALVGRTLVGRMRRHEELGTAQVERSVGESALGLGSIGERGQLAHAVGEVADARGGMTQLVDAGEAFRVDAIELVIDERAAVQSVDADRQGGRRWGGQKPSGR
jgi:hypothetical protein